MMIGFTFGKKESGMSCNSHSYESMIEELEYESRAMRARMERLEAENLELQKQVDALLIMVETKDKDRVKVMEEIWQHTRTKS